MSVVDIGNIETIAVPVRAACIFSGRAPLGPGVNGSYAPGADGHSIMSTRALRQFKKDAGLELANTTTSWWDWEVIRKIYEVVTGPQRVHTPLFMRIKIYSKTLWYYDIDGMEKALIDIVFRRINLWPYDNLIVDKRTTKEIDKCDPRIEVALYCILSTEEE